MRRKYNFEKSIITNLYGLIPNYDPERNIGNEYYFDGAAAELAIRFFHECLTHVKGELAGQPFILGPWQQAIIGNTFGWKRRIDGFRRYRELFIFVPRKNGKTCLLAGIALYLLFCDGEYGAEIYSAAADTDQARHTYEHAVGMIRQSSELSSRANIFKRVITYEEMGNSYRIISSKPNTKHGSNSHGVLLDELHAIPDRELVDVLTSSVGSRRQSLIVYITTAGFDKSSICYEVYRRACKVRDGVSDDLSFLPVVYEMKEKDNWGDISTWKNVNPNFNISIRGEYLQGEHRKAKETPSYENTFRRLHLNEWTEQETRWIPIDKWNMCGGELDLSFLKGRECWLGLDLASKIDVTALILLFKIEDIYYVLPFFWVPKETAVRRYKERINYLTWGRQGYIYLTEGDVVDYDFIRRKINELRKLYSIIEVASDPWNATQMLIKLEEADGFKTVEVYQTYKFLSEPSKELEKLVIEKKIRHGGNPVLRWMMSNVTITTDSSGNIRPNKGKSEEKIDGIVALIIALSRAIVSTGKKKSIYEISGLSVISKELFEGGRSNQKE